MHSIRQSLLALATFAVTALVVTMAPLPVSATSLVPPLPLPGLPDLSLDDSDFYVPPSPLPSGLTGDLVKTKPISLSLYPEARATRIMYLSFGARGGRGCHRCAAHAAQPGA